jgi:hypothetical protein
MLTDANKKVASKPHRWKKGESGNPKGAPKRGQSWTEIIKHIGDMTPTEASEFANKIAAKLKTIGDGITLKEAVIMRVYASLIFEPQPGLLNAFMDRVEGKPPQSVDVTSNGDTIKIGIMGFDDIPED